MAEQNEQPPPSKLTRSKQRWAREGRFLTGKSSRPEQQRLPPGQHLTRDWPVLDLGVTPQISRERWRLDVYGAVEHPLFWDFARFTAEPQTKSTSDIHCVTTWSRYDNQWEGLATRDLLMACRPRQQARHVVLHSHDGYTTNLALEDFAPMAPCSPIAGRVRRLSRNTVVQSGSWCRIYISGRAQSGCKALNFSRRMRPVIGKCAAIIIAAIHGPSSAIRGIDASRQRLAMRDAETIRVEGVHADRAFSVQG